MGGGWGGGGVWVGSVGVGCGVWVLVRAVHGLSIAAMQGEDQTMLDMLGKWVEDDLHVDTSSWTRKFPKDIPAQTNGCDCGVFVIKWVLGLGRLCVVRPVAARHAACPDAPVLHADPISSLFYAMQVCRLLGATKKVRFQPATHALLSPENCCRNPQQPPDMTMNCVIPRELWC